MKKIIFTSFLLATLFSFSSLYAETTQNQSVDVAITRDVPNCIILTHDISLGSKDSRTAGQVTKLQIFLREKAYLKNEPTGNFGKATLAAVKAFQVDNGISSTGKVGPMTRNKIGVISCSTSSNNKVSTSPKSNKITSPVIPPSVKLSYQGSDVNGTPVLVTSNYSASNIDPLIPRTWMWEVTGATIIRTSYVISGVNCSIPSPEGSTQVNWQPWVGSFASGNKFKGSNTRVLGKSYYGCTINAKITGLTSSGASAFATIQVTFANQPKSNLGTYNCNGVTSMVPCTTIQNNIKCTPQNFEWADDTYTTVVTNGQLKYVTCNSSLPSGSIGEKVQLSALRGGQVNGYSKQNGYGMVTAECILSDGQALWGISSVATKTCRASIIAAASSSITMTPPLATTSLATTTPICTGNTHLVGNICVSCPSSTQTWNGTSCIVPATPQAPVITSFTVDKPQANVGDTLTFSWNAPGANGCTFANLTTFNQSAKTSPYTEPAASGTTQYRLTCANSAGYSTPALVTVRTGSASGSPATSTVPATPQAPVITSFIVDKPQANVGDTLTFSWNAPGANGCTFANLTTLNQSAKTSPYTEPAASGTTQYKLTCANSAGYSAPSTVTVTTGGQTVITTPLPTASLTSTPSIVTYPSNILYSLSSSNALSCQVTGSDGVTYVSWSENTNQKTVNSNSTSPGVLTLTAQCSSDYNGAGTKSKIVTSSVTVNCPAGTVWDLAQAKCVTSSSNAWCSVSFSSTNFFQSAPFTVAYNSVGVTSVEYSLDGGVTYIAFIPTAGTKTNGSQTFPPMSVAPGTYSVSMRGKTTAGTIINCSPSTIVFTSKL